MNTDTLTDNDQHEMACDGVKCSWTPNNTAETCHHDERPWYHPGDCVACRFATWLDETQKGGE